MFKFLYPMHLGLMPA